MSDIFDEVQEEVRKERWEQFWKKYGTYAVTGAVIVVLAVGGYRYWQHRELERAEDASTAFLAATQLAQQGNLVGAESGFAKLAADSTKGYETAGRFLQAAVLLTENKREAALVILRELTATDDVVLASAARLQMGWVLADYAPRREVETALAPLLAPDNPFRFSASEIVAYTALRTGARAEALASYERLSKDAAAPSGVRQRAAQFAEYLRANPDINSLPLAVLPPTLPLPQRPGSAPAPAPTGPAPADAAPASATPQSAVPQSAAPASPTPVLAPASPPAQEAPPQ